MSLRAIVTRVGSPAVGAPVPSWWPLTSVIEMTANRGSTASLNVRATSSGAGGATRCAAGAVTSSDACAHAPAGAAAASAMREEQEHAARRPPAHVSGRSPRTP